MTTPVRVTRRRLGAGPEVFPLALGCMGMSDMYGPADERESIATIHAALDAGITLLDTGDYYNAGQNELLIARALKDRPGKALLSVKFGALRGPDGAWLGMDLRPAAVKNALAYSLRRLGVDHIDIYRPGRLDPAVPIEETVGAIADLITAGYVRAIGLCGAGRLGQPALGRLRLEHLRTRVLRIGEERHVASPASLTDSHRQPTTGAIRARGPLGGRRIRSRGRWLPDRHG